MNNGDITGIITVRTSSTRLPSKCLLPFGDETIITHVVNRAKSYGIEPIICTSTDPSDDVLENIAKECKIRFFRGSLNNKLKRWFDCAKHFNLRTFHTIDADDPFFDGHEVIESMRVLKEQTCDMVAPTKSSSAGGATVGYSLTTKIIGRALQNIPKDTDTEMMWYFLEKVPGIKIITLNDNYPNTPQVRLTLDYEEDYWMLASLVNILGNNATRSQINTFFFRNPDFSKINYFRNQEWKKAQLDKKT